MCYQPNFINSLRKSKNGINISTKEIYEIILISRQLQIKYPAFRKVIAVQLRLLLCDDNKSLIYKIESNPKLPPLTGEYLAIKLMGEDLYVHTTENMFDLNAEKIELKEWLNQNVMYFKRTEEDLPTEFFEEYFQQILDKLKRKPQKEEFLKKSFHVENKNIEGQSYNFYVLNSDITPEKRKQIFDILNKIGYNNLDIRTTIKNLADKEGAHIDLDHPLGLLLFDIFKDYTYIDAIADLILDYLKKYLVNNGLL